MRTSELNQYKPINIVRSTKPKEHEVNWLMDDPNIKTGTFEESMRSFDKLLKPKKGRYL